MTAVVCFPELHPALRPELAAWQGWLSLWPGLPADGGDGRQRFTPEGYPFSEREAALCLRDMRAMESAALSGVPLQALSVMQGGARAARQAAEQEELRQFMRTGEGAAPGAEALRQARLRGQKVLIWAWLLEERVLELRDLARHCSGSLLEGALGEGDAAEDFGPLDDPASQPLRVDAGLLPPWRVMLEQAALFLPDGTALLVHADMADGMEQEGDIVFSPADEAMRSCLGAPSGAVCRVARVPVWRALGKKAPVPSFPDWDKTFLFCRTEPA